MALFFQPFVQCFIEISKLLFNYSVPLFEVPLYVFLVLPLVFKILLIPVGASGANLRSKESGTSAYLASRVKDSFKDGVEREQRSRERGGD